MPALALQDLIKEEPMNTPPKSIKCNNIASLKAYLGGFQHQLNHKPNGQSMFKFADGLTLNIYETGAVVFQGNGASSPFANQVATLIDQINAPVTPEPPSNGDTTGK